MCVWGGKVCGWGYTCEFNYSSKSVGLSDFTAECDTLSVPSNQNFRSESRRKFKSEFKFSPADSSSNTE